MADTYRDHAEALHEALCREFDGHEADDVEMLLATEDAMNAYERFRAERKAEVESILTRTAPVNVTACPTCGGAGTVAADSGPKEATDG